MTMDDSVRQATLLLLKDISPALKEVIGERMEEVYAVIEDLRQDVATAVEQVRDTAQVLHDNDVALMARLQQAEGDPVAGFAARVNESWERFIRGECEQMGWRIVVPK